MAPTPKPKYFTPKEVHRHNTPDDLWVSFLGKVFDLTPLMEEHKDNILTIPIIECAGKDISHWFNPETKDIQTHVDPLTSTVKYYTPRGRFVHVPPNFPSVDWANDFGRPWWKDQQYEVGLLTAKSRWIRIVNALTRQEILLEICSEETLYEVFERYRIYNSHASSYTWKYNGVCLDMSKTLCENNIPDDEEELYHCRLDPELFIPSIFLYFNNDLTEG